MLDKRKNGRRWTRNRFAGMIFSMRSSGHTHIFYGLGVIFLLLVGCQPSEQIEKPHVYPVVPLEVDHIAISHLANRLGLQIVERKAGHVRLQDSRNNVITPGPDLCERSGDRVRRCRSSGKWPGAGFASIGIQDSDGVDSIADGSPPAGAAGRTARIRHSHDRSGPRR